MRMVMPPSVTAFAQLKPPEKEAADRRFNMAAHCHQRKKPNFDE